MTKSTATIEKRITVEVPNSTTIASDAWVVSGEARGWTDLITLEKHVDEFGLRTRLQSCTVNANECIKEIVLFGHGFPSATQTIPRPDGRAIGLLSNKAKDIFGGLNYCKPSCEIWVYSCESGVVPSLRVIEKYLIGPLSIADAIAQETGCVVYGIKGFYAGWGREMKIWPNTVDTKGKVFYG